VTLAFALALQPGDLDQAWTLLLAPSAQAQDDERIRFITRAEGLRPSYQRGALDHERATIDGDTARVDLERALSARRALRSGR
jgi:hypothetical protein